jgi:hypothetical protein
MGSSNRILTNDNNWSILENSAHMFKDVFFENGNIKYLSHQNEPKLPMFGDITLYTFLLSLHDGSFFASWWIWINDIVSVLLFILLLTGLIRWYLRSNLIKRIK